MLRQLLIGAAAGAAGTAALNIVTNCDMALRGRPASQMPAQLAKDLSERAGISLVSAPSEDPEDNKAKKARAEEIENRSSGLGALMGYATGLGLGVLFGVFRPRLRGLPLPIAAAGLAAAAMTLGDGPALAFGETKLGDWTAESWLADIVPHAIYGLVTAAACDALLGRRRDLRDVGRSLLQSAESGVRAAPNLRRLAA
jgi:hypothetical protein